MKASKNILNYPFLVAIVTPSLDRCGGKQWDNSLSLYSLIIRINSRVALVITAARDWLPSRAIGSEWTASGDGIQCCHPRQRCHVTYYTNIHWHSPGVWKKNNKKKIFLAIFLIFTPFIHTFYQYNQNICLNY